MKKKDVDFYLKEIERLRILYPHMRILAGMEVDFLDENNGPSSAEVKAYGLDYIIGSVHFIPNQKGEYFDVDGSPERFRKVLAEHFDNDLDFVVKSFWHQTQRMINAGGFDIVGHIDKIALNSSFANPGIENDPQYKNLAEETMQLAIKKGFKIEINTKHFNKYGRFFPNPSYWKQILSAGIEMPVNSDAHYASLIESGIPEAYNQLKMICKNEL